MSKFLVVCKIVVGLSFIFLLVNIVDVASNQEWSSEISPITNWGRLWETVLFLVFALNWYRLSIKVDRQDEVILQLKREFYESRDLRANYTINHSERINDIEHKIGIRN